MTVGIHTSLIQVLSTQQSTTFPFIYFVTHIFKPQPSEMLTDLLFSVTSIILVLSAIQTEWKSDIIAGAILANGINFNHVTKILLAAKFINVDFLVPFSKFEMNVSAELGAYINKLAPLWDASSWQCHLDYSTNFQKNDSAFDIDWLLHQVENEVTLAEKELEALRIYTSSFLNTEDATAQARNRKPRAAPLAIMALASVGLLGSGIALGSGSCGLRGIFGSCHDRAKQNAQNIEKLAEFTESPTQDVFKLRNEVNDKFFMVTTELEALKSVQKEMLEVQNRNWRIIEEHFEVLQHNIHVLRDCDQLLFSRQQIIFNYDTISSLLALTFANIKSYRGALYTYKINMMNSIQPLLNNYLPMSLVPRQALLAILDDVASEQWRKSDRLSLAIPMDEIIAYYESQLLRDVLVVEQGIIMRIAIPPTNERFSVHGIPRNCSTYASTRTRFGNQMEIRSAFFCYFRK